jgi:hypothetical protein
MPRNDNASFDWFLWFMWITGTAVGWTLSALLASNIGPAIAGFVIGILQWLVLQRRIRDVWKWSLATGIGWATGLAIVLYTIPPELSVLSGVILGTSLGVAQWFILRKYLYGTGWWIAISIIGWTTGLTLLPGVLTTGIIAGALTGIALELLLRNPKPATSQESNSK